MASFRKHETGYQRIQGTKPQSLGYALNDSPVGLAAWIVEKFRGWSDCNGDVETRFTKDELLTNVMLYWVTQSITSSMRLYCETERARPSQPEPRIEVPTAAAVFPKELYKTPARVGRGGLQPEALHGVPFRRPLRRARRARGAGGRHPRVLPRTALAPARRRPAQHYADGLLPATSVMFGGRAGRPPGA